MTKQEKNANFIRDIIDYDLKSGKNEGRVHTRFPPEPNGDPAPVDIFPETTPPDLVGTF